jgi:hypothetical protein
MGDWKSKAETLYELGLRIRHGKVLPMVFFDASSWIRDPQKCMESVRERLGEGRLIVRSSALSEDGVDLSNAGRYLSVPDVFGEEDLKKAISRVFASYGPVRSSADQVLVQPMAQNLNGAGVAATRDHLTGLPYVVVNLSEGGDTSIVTGGQSSMRSFTYVNSLCFSPPAPLRQLSLLIDEIERAFPDVPLDIEFGLDDLGVLLFQLRPLARCSSHDQFASKQALQDRLEMVAADVQAAMLCSESGAMPPACFGVMPDWNPAEMIGLKPTPLAYSIYDEMLMRRSWAEGRARYGYKDLTGRPLMHLFGGTPYIDICASLYSLLPASLPDEISRRIVLAAQRELERHPELHDKVEFSLFPTCYAPDMAIEGRYAVLTRLTRSERNTFEHCVVALTNDVLRRFESDFRSIDEIRTVAYGAWKNGRLQSAFDRFDFVQNNVAPLFASVARAAFIGTSIARGLHACGQISREDLDDLLFVTDTAGSRVARDLTTLSQKEFLTRHGHVRPGTYDVRVPRYDEDFATYFARSNGRAENGHRPRIRPYAGVERFLGDNGITCTDVSPLRFIQQSIWAREELKYLYAKLISDSLAHLTNAAESCGLTRDDLAFLDLRALTRERSAWESHSLQQAASEGRRRWLSSRDLRMPALLFHATDVFSYEDIRVSPNFVTQKRIVAPLRFPASDEMEGAVILIEQADPGYDWLFSYPIAGIVTAFGGSNSHMTVRAREFDVPAAIGVGGTLFERLRRASRVLLACDEQRIEVLQ